MTGSIPMRPTPVCQSLANVAGSYATLLAALGFPFTKNWPVTPSTSGEDARWIELRAPCAGVFRRRWVRCGR